MPDYANVLVNVVVILGVINRVPAAIPEHNVFCYSAVAHILTPSANLAFGYKSGFKIKCRTLLQICVGMYLLCRVQQGEIERIHPSPTNSKYRLKSFCEANFMLILGQMFLVLVRVALKRFVAFSKNGNVQEKYLSSS